MIKFGSIAISVIKRLPLFLAVALFICVSGTSFLFFAQSTDPVETPYAKCWEHELPAPLVSPAVTDNGTVFLAESEGRLRAIDSTTGLTKWSAELGGQIVSNIILGNSKLYAATSPIGADKVPENSYLRILNPASGIPERSVELPFSKQIYLGQTEDSVVSVGDGGLIVAVSRTTSETVWSQSLHVQVSAPPAFSSESVAIALSDGRLIALSGNDGSTILSSSWKFKVSAVALSKTQALIIGDDRGNVVQFNSGSKERGWKFKSGAAIASISSSGEYAVVTSLDNFVYLIDPESGNVRWRKRLAGRARFAPLIRSDHLIAPAYGERVVPILHLASGKMINKVDLGENAYPLQMPQLTRTGSIVVHTAGAISAYGQSACSPT